jgi:hypothetical protein
LASTPFGSQLQSLRIGLEYGIRTNRIVVQNPGFEAEIVKADLKLRFGDHGGDAPAAAPGGWGTGGNNSHYVCVCVCVCVCECVYVCVCVYSLYI